MVFINENTMQENEEGSEKEDGQIFVLFTRRPGRGDLEHSSGARLPQFRFHLHLLLGVTEHANLSQPQFSHL